MKPEVAKLLYETLDADEFCNLFLKFAPTRRTRDPGEHWCNPIIIAPDGEPYLYRWHVVPRNEQANVYLHIQVRSDPQRPLHDHRADNQSVILAGGYDEVYCRWPYEVSLAGQDPNYHTVTRSLRKGDVVSRRAYEAHSLILPPEIPYTMTLFTTGPWVREWGFWYPEGWRLGDEVVKLEGGVSSFITSTPVDAP